MAPKAKPKPSATPVVSIEDLFTTLDRHIQRLEYEQAVKVADQVLFVAPGDEDAIRCKIVSLIKADRIDDALSTIVACSKKFPFDFGFFKAYCLYRQNKLDDALESLKGLEKDSATMLLESQILFRQGKMDASVDINQMLQKSKIESLEINLVAGLVSAGRASEVQGMMDAMRVKATSSFELAYNAACALAERNKYSDAEQLLLSARSCIRKGGRWDYHGSDLRDKLGRHSSPPHRNLLDTDGTNRRPSCGHRSPRSGKNSDRNHTRRQHFDDESDFSGSLRMSDGAKDQANDRKPTSFENSHSEQLKQLKSEIDMLEDDNQHLEIYLEERMQEADSLNSKIKELELQLSSEKEECKRISSKIRKFVKAHNHHSKIQDELKRSEARLQKLGEHLGSDVRTATNEEDIDINILSEEETLGNHITGPRIEQHNDASPRKKRLRVKAYEGLKQVGNVTTGEGLITGKGRFEKHSRWDADLTQFKDSKEIGIDVNGITKGRSLLNEGEPRQGKSTFTSSPLADKLKDSKSGLVFPVTGIAAHADDKFVDVVESDEKFEEKGTNYMRDEKRSAAETTRLQLPLPLPPPPPAPTVLQKAYLQKGKDEKIDVDGLDDEMLDVDIV